MSVHPLAALRTDIELDTFSHDYLEQKLLDANNYYNRPENAREVIALIGLFLDHIPTLSEREKSAERLAPLRHAPFYQLPSDLVLYIFRFLPLPHLLKLRRLNFYFRDWLSSLPEYQTRITYHSLMNSSQTPRDEFKFYCSENQLAVEVVNSVCLFHLHNSYSPVIPLISRLVVKNPTSTELEILIQNMESSQKLALTTLDLCDCQLTPALFARIQTLQRERSFRVSLHDIHPETSETLAPVSSVTIESLLMKELDHLALKNFKAKVEDPSSDEVLKVFEGLNPWVQIPIIYSIWYSSVMVPDEPIPPHREIKCRVIAFISAQPHHSAINAAIRL